MKPNHFFQYNFNKWFSFVRNSGSISIGISGSVCTGIINFGKLVQLLATCALQNDNFLLNVSPDGDGKIPVEQVEILGSIGKWVKVNSKAIYGAGNSPIMAPNHRMATKVGNKVYLLIQRWPGSTVPIAWVGSKVKSACLLATGQFARVEQKGDRVWLHDMPQYPPDPWLTVVELTFEGEPKASEPAYR